MKILVTGAAGFIGFHLVNRLLKEGKDVAGLDNINDYYDIRLKHDRLLVHGIKGEEIEYGRKVCSDSFPNYSFIKMDLEDREKLLQFFEAEKFDIVFNLAAQVGVGYSVTHPHEYISSNLSGFINLLECCRQCGINHLIYASSSSVYGLNESLPYATSHSAGHPVSLYGATKRANELFSHSYSSLYGLATTGLRLFTVYGPWGRPDMALFLFTRSILAGEPIKAFNNGEMVRDFTHVDDVVECFSRILDTPFRENSAWSSSEPDPGASSASFRIYNIGNSKPVRIMDFITVIEQVLEKKADVRFLPAQKGDVAATWAGMENFAEDFNFIPSISIEEGIPGFVSWYRDYYNQ